MGGTTDRKLPQAILFACTLNAVRSPMAAAIMRHLCGDSVYVESAGVQAGPLDPFAVAVMAEIGIAIAAHMPRRFEDLRDGCFDLVVALSPEAHRTAAYFLRTAATTIEYWPLPDPTMVEGTREQRLQAYRGVRDELLRRLNLRFGGSPATPI